jgi:hypothetical protein
MGFDTEFVRNSELDCDPEEDGANSVVSYQFAVLNPRTGDEFSFWFQPEGHGKRNRLSLGGAIARALHLAEENNLIDSEDGKIWPSGKKDKIKIALACHFSRADLCGLRDFKKLKTQFDSPRGTYASTERPAVIEALMPDRWRRFSCSVTLFDTKLIAPAGYGSLSKIGSALKFPKLKLPDVIDETGATIPGITRMDLTLEQHETAFVEYAIRDAEVALRWLMEVAEFSYQWGIADKIRPTLSALATKKILLGREEEVAPILGKIVKENPFTKNLSIGDFLPEAASVMTICADTFHGGRNECHRVGIYSSADIQSEEFLDWDEAGAYTTAMAHFRAIDWARVEHTKDLERLAVCDPLTYASIDFEFPEDVNFPSLPVQTGDYGIVFPLRGSTTTIGPELIVALSQGARITVRAGVRLNWLEEGDGLIGGVNIDKIEGEDHGQFKKRQAQRLFDRVRKRPFAAFAQTVNIKRAEAKAEEKASAKAECRKEDKSPFELMAKECGNSGFGRLGMAICNMKSTPERRKLFSSRDGDYRELEPSAMTAPHLASYTSGLPRALLSEIISRLPEGVDLLSCTTDGFLSSLTPAQIDHVTDGPVAQHFSFLRTLVSPTASPQVLELKHTARAVISAKTRGNFALEVGSDVDGSPSKLICARAGHRLENVPDTQELEIQEWLRIYRERRYDTKLKGMVFNSIKEQFDANADLVEIWRDVKVNLCFDMKRRPIEATIATDPAFGMIRFNTRPWGSCDEFLKWRHDFDAWRGAASSCLKTPDDWERFKAWRESKPFRSAAKRTPWQQWLMQAAAHGVLIERKGRARNSSGRALAEIAALLTEAGVPEVTREILDHAARNKLDLTQPDKLEGDEIIMEKLAKMGVLKTARGNEVITITSLRDGRLAHQESELKYKDKTTPTIEEIFDTRTGVRGASLVRASKSEIKN